MKTEYIDVMDIGDIFTPHGYNPWYAGKFREKNEDAFVVIMSDPDRDEEFEHNLRVKVTKEMIVEAFEQVEDILCCANVMLYEGFGFGCANDADLIYQQAVYGEIIYG